RRRRSWNGCRSSMTWVGTSASMRASGDASRRRRNKAAMRMERAGTMASVLPQHVAEEGVARPLLEIRHAMKRFITPEGQDVVALDEVSISGSRHEFRTLLGPSGCCQTTVLRVASGCEELDAGEICIDDENIAGRPAYRRQVNSDFQFYALFRLLSVARSVAYRLEDARA